jgi:hypothetical protein
VAHKEQKLKEIIPIHDAQTKDVLDNMYAEKSNKEKVAETASKLILEGYMVQKICCGECDQDDLLIQIHTCNPHNYTHKCTPKNKK